jgi:glycosyltransferase involved in cell wall biosynthesis
MERSVENCPTLSVLMPNYNHSQFLPESLGAILSQSYRPSEIFIIDDASTDNSVEVIEEIARREPIVRLVRNERNMGVEWNVNRLLQMAEGEYIYSPSADDIILPGFFEKSMALLAQHPQAGLCSSVARLISENGEDRGIRAMPVISNKPRFFAPQEVRHVLRKYGRWIDSGSVIYRRQALEDIGGYEIELGSFSDTFANLVIALQFGACFVPEPLSCWRRMAMGYANRSATDWKIHLGRQLKAAESMRTTYGELFPKDFVTKFERHSIYSVSYMVFSSAWREQRKTFEDVLRRVCPTPLFGDRVVWAVMQLAMQIQASAWRLYLMIKFGPLLWWLRGRLSAIFNLRKLIISDGTEL